MRDYWTPDVARDTVKFVEQRIRNGKETLNFSGDELEYATPTINAAVYLFSSNAFYKSVFSIKSDKSFGIMS